MNKSGRLKIFAFSLFMMAGYFAFAGENVENRMCHKLYEIAKDVVTDKVNQPLLKNILLRHVIKDGRKYYLMEIYFPEGAGEFQSSDFYDPAGDSARWVETLLIHAEEERIAGELDEMENELEGYNEGEISEEPENGLEAGLEAELEAGGEGKSLVNKDSELEVFQYDNEVLMRQKTADGLSIINSSGSNVTRNFYDDKMRITSRERWNISNVDNAALQEKESFIYDADTYRVVSKVITTVITDGEQTEEISYNQNSLVKQVLRYITLNQKKYVTLERFCSYNEDGKILSDETVEYHYKEDYKKLSSKFSKKYIYEYNAEDIPPDFKYYENGIVKMHNKYSDIKGTYTSHVYFDDSFSVKSYFENDVRVREVYYNGNKVTREKVYETQQKQ